MPTKIKPLIVPPRGELGGGTFLVTLPSPQRVFEPGAILDEDDRPPRKWELLVHATDASGHAIQDAQLNATVVEASRGALRFQDIARTQHDAIARRGVTAALFAAVAADDLLELGYAVQSLTSSDRSGKGVGEFLSTDGDDMWQRFVRDLLADDDGPEQPYRWKL